MAEDIDEIMNMIEVMQNTTPDIHIPGKSNSEVTSSNGRDSPENESSSINDLDEIMNSISHIAANSNQEDVPNKPSRLRPAGVPPVKPSRRQKKKEPEKIENASEPTSGSVSTHIEDTTVKKETTAEEIESLIDELDAQITINKESKKKDENSSKTNSDNPLDDMLGTLTDDLNARGITAKSKGICPTCKRPVIGEAIAALAKVWHPEHFVCCVDDKEIGQDPYYTWNGNIYCMDHYQELFSPECSKCSRPILDNLISAMDKSFHADCFVCSSCENPVLENFHEHEGNPYCQECYLKCIAPKCLACKNPILSNYIAALEGYWHPDCFICQEQGCGPFKQGSFFELDGLPYCEKHFLARKGAACAQCSQPINGKCVSAMGRRYHPHHFLCTFCQNTLTQGIFKEHNDKPFCHSCYQRVGKRYN